MKIEIYSTTTCPYCLLAKQYFDQAKTDYTDYDVADNQEKAQEMVEISGQMGVPVIVIAKNDEDPEPTVIIGFDKEAIEETLSKKE